MTPYAEFAARTNFSFLEGASHGEEMAQAAQSLGLSALGVADRNSFAGIVRAHAAAKELGLRYHPGVRLIARDGFTVLAYPSDRAAYGRLCKLLTLGNRRAAKGQCDLGLDDICAAAEGQYFILIPPAAIARLDPKGADAAQMHALTAAAGARIYLGAAHLYQGDDQRRLQALAALARDLRIPMLAMQDALYHDASRRVLQDILTCIRHHAAIDTAGFLLNANAERHLKSPLEMARLFRHYPEALAATQDLSAQLTFSLDVLRYEYPDEIQGASANPQAELERLAWAGAARRYPAGVPDMVRDLVARELALVGQLNYAPYFLTVEDIVRYARTQGILAQGRGSAANSAVCFCLGITEVDPARIDVLFERFISAERNEPPDIDVDFEHERREEVIQYIYRRYGRHRAGIAATVITYRWRSAIREVAKALGLSADIAGALSGAVWGWDESVDAGRLREVGLDPGDARLTLAVRLARALTGFPRHLSQHVGGFVITRGPLDALIPIGNAAMEDRTFVEWDKDDLDALGILKIDVLALGMLTCIAKALQLLRAHYGRDLSMATIPAEDPAVYAMLQKADSVGVFQVESRAQMSMLPRLKPACFYDLVVEVAIVRPGPIQGDMVHPYLRRREGLEPVTFPSEELRAVLGKTMGVPLFQEQAMRIAIVAAGFTGGEADRLRRAMATFRRNGTIHLFREKFIGGMARRGYDPEFAARCFAQIEGFGEYGFPESHAASFALLVYVSAWIKCHYPDVFCAAILNSQPLGFYAPAQLVRDAQEHGVTVLPPCINSSDWDCTLEGPFHSPPAEAGGEPDGVREGGKPQAPFPPSSPFGLRRGTSPTLVGEDFRPRPFFPVRLGFRQIKGFSQDDAARLTAARGCGFDGARHLWLASRLSGAALERLADADAFRSVGLDRREALWAVRGLDQGAAARAGRMTALAPLPLFAHAETAEEDAERALPAMALGEHVAADYAHLRLSLKAHPMTFLRARYTAQRIVPNARLVEVKDGARVRAAGLVLVRQRPGTASGVIFITLEDEGGIANLIVWPKTFERYRRAVLGARLMFVEGRLQREGIVTHIIVDRLEDWTHDLTVLSEDTRLEPAIAHADEVKRPNEDKRQAIMERSQARAAAGLPRSRDFH
jgi:error-prone DNA polymerase